MYRVPIAVAILGGGAGSNADALIRHGLRPEAPYRVRLVISTRADAGILDVARRHNVEWIVLPAKDWESFLEQKLTEHSVGVLALAGFMRKLPQSTIAMLNGNVLNVHPALLPKYGGAGMYGLHVHRAVLAAGETVTGATVHRVTADYDEGAVLAQQSLPLADLPSAEDLQQRVKHLEHDLYPRALDAFCRTILGGGGPIDTVPLLGAQS
jgi:phosphoribosylglycinamide formyltransferase-1